MKFKEIALSTTYLRRRLDYNLDTGILTWKPIPVRNRFDKTWNKRYAGKPAGCVRPDGYVALRMDGVTYLAHRIIWLWMTGEQPPPTIDHLGDGEKSDNRWELLRAASQSQQNCNRKLQTNNKSGFRGVYWAEHVKRWFARVCKDGRTYFGGYHDTAEEAYRAYKRMAAELHGEFVHPSVLTPIS